MAALVAGRLDLRTSFSEPEDGFAYLVDLSGMPEGQEVSAIPGAAIPERYLPAADTMLRRLEPATDL